MSGGGSGVSFEYTLTWVVAVVCFVIVSISFAAEQALHRFGKCFRRKRQEALFEALQNLKEELMLLGFISLLLTVFQGLIKNICIPRNLAEVMLPCKLETHRANNGRRLLAEESLSQSCPKEHCPSHPNNDFHKYVLRILEQDFKKSWYLWLFVVIFLLVNIAELATDAAQRADETEGTRVRPSDELFWFHRPALVLYLIHFILFQNSFEIAFLFWIWSTYGFRSCIMEELGSIITRIVIGWVACLSRRFSTSLHMDSYWTGQHHHIKNDC